MTKFIKLADFKTLLRPRPHDAHKGLFGHVLIIGGDYGMAGAVRLAGEAALRVGAGLVTVATHPEHIAAIIPARPELMCHGVIQVKTLKTLLAKASVIILGPGLGQSAWSKQLFKTAMAAPQPKVIDADGLNLLAQNDDIADNWILTPHPGEAARLLGRDVRDIQAERAAAVQSLQKKYGGVAILKGEGTLVCTKSTVQKCRAGNPGMASGGMGDVLSGVIGGLLAQHFTLREAAVLGVLLHAQAGDNAAHAHGERGMLASDLLPYLRELVNPT